MIFYYKYYLEIRNRISLILVCWCFVSTTCYFYKEVLLFLFINLNNDFLTSSIEYYFIFTNVSELFSVYLEIVFFISNQITLSFLIYHFILFISSGLYKIEYKKILLLFKMFILSWMISSFLLSLIILPISTTFFLSFQQTGSGLFFFEAKIIEYFNYVVSLYYMCLISCQLLLLIIFILINFSNNSMKIKQFRKLFYLVFLLFATLVTPPDVISQLLVGINLIIFYELILIIILINKATN